MVKLGQFIHRMFAGCTCYAHGWRAVLRGVQHVGSVAWGANMVAVLRGVQHVGSAWRATCW